jgi:pSer/pThr/pTyr-binding forkhead associated (FHA) protein
MPWILDIHRDLRSVSSVSVVESVMTVGREGCDINIDDLKMSRHHCTFYLHDDVLTVIDNSSSNGTFVNGRKIDRRELKAKDTIIIGITNITVRKV